jgi:iron complex outermembrane recepter protein
MGMNKQLTQAVRCALATGAIAVCGAGCLAAHAQQTSPGSGASNGVQTAQAQTTTGGNSAGVAQLQEVVITGSLIARTSVETPNPVQVLSSKDLVQSGYTDVSDVLRNIPSNGASTLSQSFSFAFASGASGISLRGLSVGDTLVLIDGERTVPYPLLDDNERSFVDLASIPFTAIQQVQVLKDGGSALYGSDAIAGVVNVMLRKEYQGFQVTTESGTSQHWDGTTEHLGFIGGEGDLASDGYNWYVSGDFRHQDQILAADRSGLWTNLDWTPWGGYNRTPGANALENPDIPYPASITGYLINPATTSGLPYAYLPGCDATSQALDRCTYDVASAQLQPSDTNIDLLAKFTKELAGGWELGLQGSWFDSKSEQAGSYASNADLTFAGGTGYATGGITTIGLAPGAPAHVTTYPIITLPAGYPGNPFGVAAPLIYEFPELGAQTTTTNTNTYRLLASLTGNAAGWQINGTVGAMYAKMALTHYGNIEPGALQTALNNGYILGSAGGASLFAPPAETTPTSQLDLADLHGTRKLLELPGGPLDLVIGAQWYKETHDETPPADIEAGIQEGDSTYVIGDEYDRAAFAELDGKPLKQLELDAQARYDNYQTFGSDTTPKVGVKFTPWDWIGLRGTWGKGFRVPSAAEGIASGEAFGAGKYDDPILCPNPGTPNAPGNFPSQCELGLVGVLTANQHLKDVTSTNWTTGLILQPIPQVSATVDYYNIKIDNDILPVFETGVGLAGYTSLVRGPQVVLPYVNSSGQTVDQLTPVGTILEANYPYVNASSTHTTGYDVDLKYHWDMGSIGRFTGEASWTHELTYQLTVSGVTYELAGTHGPSGVSGDTGNPKDRFNVRLSWTKGPLTITPSVNFIGHFSIIDPSADYDTCAESLGFEGNFPSATVTPAEKGFCNVGYFLETDVYGSYQVTGNFEVHASVTNLFNKTPPVDVATYGSGSLFYPYDAALEQDGAVGRYFLVGLTYDF